MCSRSKLSGSLAWANHRTCHVSVAYLCTMVRLRAFAPHGAREREHFLLGIEPPFTACATHDNIGNVWRHHDNLSTFSQFVLIILHIATDSCLLSLFSCRMHGCNYAIGYIIKHQQCNFCYHMHKYFMLVPTMAFLDGASTITKCEPCTEVRTYHHIIYHISSFKCIMYKGTLGHHCPMQH